MLSANCFICIFIFLQHIQRKPLSTHFCLHEVTEGHDWTWCGWSIWKRVYVLLKSTANLAPLGLLAFIWTPSIIVNINREKNHGHSPVRIRCCILDLLCEGELVTADTGTHCIHAVDTWEVEASSCNKIYRNPDLKVLVQVGKVCQHVRVLWKQTREEDRLWESYKKWWAPF